MPNDKLPALPPSHSSYKDLRLKSLKEPLVAANYLLAAAEDSPEAFNNALANINEANRQDSVALQPRPVRIAGAAFFYEEQVEKYMDAQDARVKELEKERDLWKNRAIGFSKGMTFMEEKTGVDADHFVFEGLKAMTADLDRIAELEREIREAHRLLDYAVCLHVRDTDEWGNWCETRMEWIDRDDKRNAERATEQ